jgi:hypothetical protein
LKINLYKPSALGFGDDVNNDTTYETLKTSHGNSLTGAIEFQRGNRITLDGMREVISAIALQKRGFGRYVPERSETRHAGDYRTVHYGGSFYPSA